ncbi:MAG TPA: iron-sulfur cluster assembly scaffold protein [Candidatus Acidoferrum sp.]|nr:iron-sulfur cluster assembly scaffold protein [Candidatus Acidoferrum sp.]
MLSERILLHFREPYHAGEMADATSVADVSNPVCGDIMRLAVKMEGGKIREARFKTQGCVASIAAGSVLTGLLEGKTVQEARKLSAKEVSDALGELPQASFHAAQLCVDAVAAVLKNRK